MSSLCECITRSSSLSIEEIKLFAIVNWVSTCQIFWDYLLCFLNMVWFYKDILQLIVFYFYHLYFQIQYKCYFQNYLLLLVYNNFLLLRAQKNFYISLSIIYLIDLFYFILWRNLSWNLFFFFLSKNNFFIFNCCISCSFFQCFFNLKRPLISLIIFSSARPGLSIIICCKKD